MTRGGGVLAVGAPAVILDASPTGGSPFRRFEHHALGTWNTLLLSDSPAGGTAQTESAANAAWALLDRLEDELSRFRPESDVSLLNALGGHQPVPAGRALWEILRVARRAWEETGGAFDPTVGPLMDAWGFHGEERILHDEEIAGLLARRGMDHVVLDEAARTVRFDREGVRIDLGAIGKGYAVDRLRDLLQNRGVPAGAILSGRSTIAVWGTPPDADGWRAAVVHPLVPEETIRTLELEPGSLSTSGAYEKRFVREGVEYGHVLDPRTGRPVRSPVKSVTVWTPGAMEGDVLSTALFVLGRAAGEPLVRRAPRATALFVEEDDSAWGGLRTETLGSGSPGFKVLHCA